MIACYLPDTPAGYSIQEAKYYHSGLQAVLYKENSTSNYVLAFAGTNPTSVNDLCADGGQSLGYATQYYSSAISLARTLSQSLPRGSTLTFTGHSLGGGLASAASHVTGHPAVVFNPAAVHPNTVADYEGDFHNVISYVVDRELVGRLEKRVGLATTAGTTIRLASQSNELTGTADHLMSRVDAGLKGLMTRAQWAMSLRKK